MKDLLLKVQTKCEEFLSFSSLDSATNKIIKSVDENKDEKLDM